MKPRDYQIDLAAKGIDIIKQHMIVYYAMEERTGKSLTALLVCEALAIRRVLIITKKKPIEGWESTLDAFDHTKEYTVTNYHQVKKFNPEDYDLLILDEAHNYISGYPKPSAIWKEVKRLAKGKPLIYLSATPYAQTPALLYHQFALSSWSPWRLYQSYYSWWRSYGTGATKWVYQREVPCYDQVKDDKVIATCQHLFISKTRKDLGFTEEPKDKIHFIELNSSTKEAYNSLVKDKVLRKPIKIVADTTTLLRTALHQLEGGTIKVTALAKEKPGPSCVKRRKETLKDEEGKLIGVIYHDYYVLPNTEKIDYIKETFGDSENVAIMYNYIGEGHKLREAFNKALILQATSFAEGVDLHKVEHLVIYSQDFSTARHTQRRARQANLKRKMPIIVHFLLVKGGISEQVYQTVSIKKRNYVDSVFERREI